MHGHAPLDTSASSGGTTHPRVGPADRRIGLLVFVGALALTSIAAGVPAFWYDEAATLRLARLPPEEFLTFVSSRDAVHAVYAAFMHIWIGVLGESELAVRLPSILAVAFGALGVFVLSRDLGCGRWQAIAASSVFILLPRTLLQGIEARSYSVATALVIAAALLAFRAKGSPKAVACVAGCIAVTTIAVWTFAYAILVTPAFAIAADDRAGTVVARLFRALALVVAPAALSGPLFAAMLTQRGQVSWLAEQALNPYTVVAEPFFGWAGWLIVPVLALLVWGAVRGRFASTGATAALLVWMLLPAAVLIGISLLVQPSFTPRYVALSAPALALLCGIALRGVSRRVIVSLSILWALLVLPFAVTTRTATAKPGGLDLRAISSGISADARPGDGFLLQATGTGALWPRTAIAAYPDAFAPLDDIAFRESFVTTGTYWDVLAEITVEDLRGHDRVWTASGPEGELPALLENAGFAPSSATTITGVDVILWVRP